MAFEWDEKRQEYVRVVKVLVESPEEQQEETEEKENGV